MDIQQSQDFFHTALIVPPSSNHTQKVDYLLKFYNPLVINTDRKLLFLV